MLENNLEFRKGIVHFDKDVLFNSGEKVLKLIFSDFYPVDVKTTFVRKSEEDPEIVQIFCEYLFISQYFRVLESEEETPLYEIVFGERITGSKKELAIVDIKELKK